MLYLYMRETHSTIGWRGRLSKNYLKVLYLLTDLNVHISPRCAAVCYIYAVYLIQCTSFPKIRTIHLFKNFFASTSGGTAMCIILDPSIFLMDFIHVLEILCQKFYLSLYVSISGLK